MFHRLLNRTLFRQWRIFICLLRSRKLKQQSLHIFLHSSLNCNITKSYLFHSWNLPRLYDSLLVCDWINFYCKYESLCKCWYRINFSWLCILLLAICLAYNGSIIHRWNKIQHISTMDMEWKPQSWLYCQSIL